MRRWTRHGLLALLLCGLLLTAGAFFFLTWPATPASPSAKPVGTVQVLALGDSVTAGTNCDCDAFPKVYTQTISTRTGDTVRLDNHGEPGATSADVLAYLQSTAGTKAAERADVVLLTIGANDFSPVAPEIFAHTCGGTEDLDCTRPALLVLQSQLAEITERLHDLRGDQPTALLITDYWNVFEDGDIAEADYSSRGRTASDLLTREVNTVIERSADQGGGIFVDLYAPFKGYAGDRNPTSLLADDGDHPDEAGHRVIAQALVTAGLGQLTLSPVTPGPPTTSTATPQRH